MRVLGSIIGLTCALAIHAQGMAADQAMPLCPADGLKKLVEGNKRYVQDKLEHPNRTQESRAAVSVKQTPFATILGCSDSRVPPEILFDQGVGDLFIVRVAGNVAGPVEIDSIDYSVLHLGACLVVVLGHEGCGAVTAVIDNQAQGIQAVAELIEPAVKESKNLPGDRIVNATKANIRHAISEIKKSPVVAKLIQEGKVAVVGGYYDLDTGSVEILSQ